MHWADAPFIERISCVKKGTHIPLLHSHYSTNNKLTGFHIEVFLRSSDYTYTHGQRSPLHDACVGISW